MNYAGSITELSFFKSSAVFVEFFFVLSGFVLTHTYAFKKNINFKDFVVSRTFRLLPLHIVMLFVLIIIEVGKLAAYQYGITFTSPPFTGQNDVAEIIPNLLLLQSWLPFFDHNSFNSPSWSISIEYYMYMIFYFSLIIKNSARYILWFLISFSMFSLIFMGAEITAEILRGLSCFFAGALTYVLYKNIHHKFKATKIYFTVLETILIVSVVGLVSSSIEHKSLTLSLVFCLQVFVFAFEKGALSQLLRQQLFLHAGKLSYSIYMVHYAILFCAIAIVIIAQKLFGIKMTMFIDGARYIDFGNLFYNNLAVLFLMGVIIYVSGLTNKFIEQKGQELGRKIISK